MSQASSLRYSYGYRPADRIVSEYFGYSIAYASGEYTLDRRHRRKARLDVGPAEGPGTRLGAPGAAGRADT